MIGVATTGPIATNKLMYKDLQVDPQRELDAVALIGTSPVLVVARNDAPATSISELVSFSKANPEKLSIGFPGRGSQGHITGVLLQQRAGIKVREVQYRGSAQIITDLHSDF